MSKLSKYGTWAVVTGGSAGIGREFAEQIAKQRMNVILVARRREPLAVAATELRARYGVQVDTVVADLATEDGVAEAIRAADEREAGLAVINAGVGYGGDFVRRELDDYLREVRVNIEGPVRMLHHFARRFADRRNGGIVLTSSMGGYFSAPYLAHYVATKAYQLSLGEALSKELSAYGVDLTVLMPPATDTQMGKHGVPGIDASKLPMLWSNPAKVARAGLDALGRRPSVLPGFVNRVMQFTLTRLVPRRLSLAVWAHIMGRAATPDVAPPHRRTVELEPQPHTAA